MIKTDKKINYGAALQKLLDGYNFAQEKVNSEDDYKYPNAYGRLQSAVKGLFLECTGKYPEELNPPPAASEAPTLLLQTENDIPNELYMSVQARKTTGIL